MKRTVFLCLLSCIMTCSLLFFACHREMHFITDADYRAQVEKDFEARKLLAEGRATELFSVLDSNLSTGEREALQFLYAYMPYSDLADYDGDFFLKQVRYAFAARDTFAWGRTVPENIFRHFVLVYRVNNENLDTARMFIFNELKDRVKGMSMYDAALEVNHWCHEKVSYRPSDMRTSAPLATIRTGLGRCGEESTLAVTALRAVGIPARQCYTPRWAHCDDNHAWVEVWVDGKWYYLGACEPAAKLNMAWFTLPATRCMMVHSNAFGRYKGEEEINYSGTLYAKINMLPNYAETRKITATVADADGKPIAEATVKFKLYNYSEYYPIAEAVTDAQGRASLTTGLGDLLVWASKDGKYDYAKIDVRQSDKIALKLTRTEGKEYIENLEINPPASKIIDDDATPEEIAANNRRLQYEDSLRNAYWQTFPTNVETCQGTSPQLQPNPNLSDEQVWEIIHKSEGNYAEIIKFINNHANEQLAGHLVWDAPCLDCEDCSGEESWSCLYDYLTSFSDKDLRDITAEVLEAHWAVPPMHPLVREYYNYYKKGLLPARISNEMVRPYREELGKVFQGFTADSLRRWTEQHIAVDDTGNYYHCPISPVGVYKLRHADPHSRDIFFIAACRSIRIPAYMDNATGQLFVYENDKWNIVSFAEKQEPAKTGKLKLVYKGNTGLKPQYWTHFTIARFENGDFVTFDYENDPRVAKFPATLELEAGYYLLSTGNRYSDGTVLSRMEFFNIPEGSTETKEIIILPLEARAGQSYGYIAENTRATVNGNAAALVQLAKEKPLVLCFIDPNSEPTRHTLKELGAMKADFEKWGGNILMVIPKDKLTQPFDKKHWNLPENTMVTTDDNGLLAKILSDTKQYFRDNYPLIFIMDNRGQLIFKSEGYRIGTAELVFKSL
ncbi:MAG: transglutaminase domain-containing protein [Bacteroidales bacterium]|nr:transglutaminase domain-containing protein [Bacteroidales bacterium]